MLTGSVMDDESGMDPVKKSMIVMTRRSAKARERQK
jgi:hypothetical protein